MGFLENRRGIPPSYAAARAALSAALAAELCLTGRIVDAEEAHRLGVVAEVHAPDDLMPRATAVAAEIAAAPRSASIETKRRILIERQTCWQPLFEAEEQALREALLGA
jgi:enoyl-CoA hydratase/carnithine racemase